VAAAESGRHKVPESSSLWRNTTELRSFYRSDQSLSSQTESQSLSSLS
jgi:hypothetical protein